MSTENEAIYEKFNKWHKEEYGYAPNESECDSEQWKRVAHRERGFMVGYSSRSPELTTKDDQIKEANRKLLHEIHANAALKEELLSHTQEIDKLNKRIQELEGALNLAKETLDEGPELNMANYSEIDVAALNHAASGAWNIINKALLTPPSPAKTECEGVE